MRPISNEFSNALLENSTLLVKATLRLADGTVRELTGDDVVDLSVEQATSSDGGFDIGACVIGKCDVTLNNHDRRFDTYDFAGSTIAPHVGKSLPSGVTEWVPLGTFYADQPDAYGGTIAISCLDGMSLLERGIDGVTLTGATMASAISNICAKCGIPYDAGSMSRHISTNATITATFDDRTSCLDVMSSICQYHGCFGRIANGRLTFGWYDTAAVEGESWLNGGVLDDGRPYSTGAVADGGSLSDYATGDRADGGGFDGNGSVAHLFNCTSLSVSTDDVVVTGIEVTAQDKEEAGDGQQSVAGETVLSGTKGYVLSIDGNRLVACGTAGEVASRVAGGIVGMRFRPFAANANCDPSIEPGDAVVVADNRGNTYVSYVTSVSLRVNGGMAVRCSAKSASRNSAVTASATTKAIVEARNAIRAERSERERAMAEFKEASTGLYSTDHKLEDGSVVHFLHDKPTIAASRIIWKMTAEAVAVSTDGGKTYATGLSADGTAVLNRLSATGIDASVVSIRNLMSIGDQNGSHVELSHDRLRLMDASSTLAEFRQRGQTFYIDGRRSFSVDTLETTYVSRGRNSTSVSGICTIGGKNNSVGNVFITGPAPIPGRPIYVSIGLGTKAMSNVVPRHKGNGVYETDIKYRWGKDSNFRIDVSITASSSGFSVRMSKGVAYAGDDNGAAYVDSLYITYETNATSALVKSGEGTLLDTNSFCKTVRDSYGSYPFSGTFKVMSNVDNTLVTYTLKIMNGLIVDVDVSRGSN